MYERLVKKNRMASQMVQSQPEREFMGWLRNKLRKVGQEFQKDRFKDTIHLFHRKKSG
jgi:hypothetical protein